MKLSLQPLVKPNRTDELDGIKLGGKKMKKVLRLTIMAALVIIVCLPSCKKEETDASKLILGRWTITSGNLWGETISDFRNETWEFKGNGSFYGALNAEEGKFVDYVDCNYTLTNNKLQFKGGDFDSGEWLIRRFELVIDNISITTLEVSGNCICDDEEGGTFTVPASFKLTK